MLGEGFKLCHVPLANSIVRYGIPLKRDLFHRRLQLIWFKYNGTVYHFLSVCIFCCSRMLSRVNRVHGL